MSAQHMNKNMFSLNVFPANSSVISEIKSPGLDSKERSDSNQFNRMFEPTTPGKNRNMLDR